MKKPGTSRKIPKNRSVRVGTYVPVFLKIPRQERVCPQAACISEGRDHHVGHHHWDSSQYGFACSAADPAMAVVAIISAVTVPLYNVLAVFSLSMYSPNGASGKDARWGTFKKILRNPMIIGTRIGVAFLLVRELQLHLLGSVVFSVQDDLPFVFKAVSNVKSITTPFALMILGAEFEFSAIKGMFREVAVGTFFRLVGAPLIGILAAWRLSSHTGFLSFGPNEYAAFIALFGSPVAVSSVAMAEQMDGDSALAAQLVVWSSIFSILTIFLQVCILMAVELL